MLEKLQNEALLIRRAQQGDASSFGLIYDHYLPPIYRFVFLKINKKAEAEDLTHETFLSAWRNIVNFQEKGIPLSSWLYRIARNKIIDHYRTKKEYLPVEKISENEIMAVNTIEQETDATMGIESIRQAIGQLNDEQQTVLIMRFVEDADYQEIGVVLDKSEGAVRVIQHRAIQNLKKLIHENEQQFF